MSNTTTIAAPKRVANYTIGQGWRSDNYRLVTERQEWQGSNFRGGPRWTGDVGRLPAEHRDGFYRSDYAIWSYATPIAWHVPGHGWVMPEVKYSITTTKHQHLVRMAFHYGEVQS